MKKVIGLRTIKTGISVYLSVIISNLLNLEYPFFVCMTAIVSMDKTAKLSLKMGKNRVFGTMCGALLGLVFNYVDAGNPILCGIGIILLILFLNQLNMQGAIPISGIVFSAMMVHLGDKSPILYGMHRTLDSFIGASITCLVNFMILPYYNVSHIDEDIEKFAITIVKLQKQLQFGQVIVLDDMIKISKKIESNLDLYVHEIMSLKNKQKILDICAKYRFLKEVLEELIVIEKIKDDQYVYKYHLKKIDGLIQQYENLI